MALDVQYGGHWRDDAACLGAPGSDEVFFPISDVGEKRAGPVADARVYCVRCPVIAQCAERALDPKVTHGIWAGIDLGDGGRATMQSGKRALRALVDGLRAVAS